MRTNIEEMLRDDIDDQQLADAIRKVNERSKVFSVLKSVAGGHNKFFVYALVDGGIRKKFRIKYDFDDDRVFHPPDPQTCSVERVREFARHILYVGKGCDGREHHHLTRDALEVCSLMFSPP